LDCAGVHRGFGVETSFIRSITMDKWKAKHVQLMKNGGNNRLKKLLNEYGVDHNYPKEVLYYTKLLDYYRTCVNFV
jgi:ADP-ribosylation factor GTPase-activating protein 1